MGCLRQEDSRVFSFSLKSLAHYLAREDSGRCPKLQLSRCALIFTKSSLAFPPISYFGHPFDLSLCHWNMVEVQPSPPFSITARSFTSPTSKLSEKLSIISSYQSSSLKLSPGLTLGPSWLVPVWSSPYSHFPKAQVGIKFY